MKLELNLEFLKLIFEKYQVCDNEMSDNPFLIVANYKTLCDILGIKPLTSDSKKSQLKELSKYFDYSICEFDIPVELQDKIYFKSVQRGKKTPYIIYEIYDEPLKTVLRKNKELSVYLICKTLKRYYKNKNNNEYANSYSRLLQDCGYLSNAIVKTNMEYIERVVKKLFNCPENDLYYENYLKAVQNMQDYISFRGRYFLKSALKKMQEQDIIKSFENVNYGVNVLEDELGNKTYSYTPLTPEENILFEKIKKEVLGIYSYRFGGVFIPCDSMSYIFSGKAILLSKPFINNTIKTVAEDFQVRLGILVKEKLGYDYITPYCKITFDEDKVNKFIIRYERDNDYVDVNEDHELNFFNKLKSNIEKKYDKMPKEYYDDINELEKSKHDDILILAYYILPDYFNYID